MRCYLSWRFIAIIIDVLFYQYLFCFSTNHVKNNWFKEFIIWTADFFQHWNAKYVNSKRMHMHTAVLFVSINKWMAFAWESFLVLCDQQILKKNRARSSIYYTTLYVIFITKTQFDFQQRCNFVLMMLTVIWILN